MEENIYHNCFVCGQQNSKGLHLEHTYEGELAKARIIIEEDYAGYSGVVHGGIVSALLDEIMAKSIEILGLRAMTANLEIRFRKPTPTRATLYLTGKVIRRGGRIFKTEGSIALEDGTIVAEAKGTFVRKYQL